MRLERRDGRRYKLNMFKTAWLFFLVTSCSTAGSVGVGTGGESGRATPEVRSGLSSTAEVCDVRRAIVTALRASTEEWAGTLADETEGVVCELDTDGTAQIGPWTMAACHDDCEGRSLRFLYRREGAQVPTFAAEVVRRNQGFSCINLAQFMIVPTTSPGDETTR